VVVSFSAVNTAKLTVKFLAKQVAAGTNFLNKKKIQIV